MKSPCDIETLRKNIAHTPPYSFSMLLSILCCGKPSQLHELHLSMFGGLLSHLERGVLLCLPLI